MSNTIKLQGLYGEQPAKAVKDLRIGDIVTWNYGYKSEVIAMLPSKSGKTYEITFKSLERGYIGTRKMTACRLVASEVSI